jgi:hypothetical protein
MKKIFYITEVISEKNIEWAIEAVSNYPPSREEPLVLAALFKILLKRPAISPHLEFGMDELIEEIGWEHSLCTQNEIDRVISNYASFSFYKEPRNKRANRVGLKWGYYSLITAYFRETIYRRGESVSGQTVRCIELAYSFIDGIKRGQVNFADINFGQIH